MRITYRNGKSMGRGMNHERIIVSRETCHKVFGRWYFQLSNTCCEEVDEPEELATGEMLILASVPWFLADNTWFGLTRGKFYVYKKYRGEMTPHDTKYDIARMDVSELVSFESSLHWARAFARKRYRYLLSERLDRLCHIAQDSHPTLG